MKQQILVLPTVRGGGNPGHCAGAQIKKNAFFLILFARPQLFFRFYADLSEEPP